MSSYLEAYGEAERLRARRIRAAKIGSLVLVVLLIAGFTLYALFKNHSEEQQADLFIQLLKQHDYQKAYALWGCTPSTPCPNYSFDKFMADWGPQSHYADASKAHIGLSQSCGSGVVMQLDYQSSQPPVPIWVERSSNVISFAPWPECPGRHLHLRAWLRSVFKR